MARRPRGFSLVEFGVVACVLALLLGLLLNRLTYYQEAAERANFENTLQIYKTALQIRLAELIQERREFDARALEAENPTLLLAQQPANYGGELPPLPRPGTWYFDPRAHELVYVVNTGARLQVAEDNGMKTLRFRVRLIVQPIHAPGGPVQGIGGITLSPAGVYQWS